LKVVSGMDEPIHVTRPYLPPLEELQPYLEKIWARRRLTNAGPFHQEFESALAEFLGVEHVSLFANGTLALVTALQSLRISGEVITTPYSFVATAHSLLWNGIKPVFVDIERESFNIDPEKIEASITPQTTAIMPVHVYARPAAVGRIQEIADRYGLKVIYDAAHAFAVRDAGGSVLRHGDLSILSFHATKVFTTFEGGAIISPDAKTKKRIDYLKNFGFADEVSVVAPGINGKLNELQAAIGLAQLAHVEEALRDRERVDACYRTLLANVAGISIPPLPKTGSHNFAYFPILVGDEYPRSRDALHDKLVRSNIFVRRYFYPLISDFPMYRGLPSSCPKNLPVASDVAARVICLPIYPGLEERDIARVVDLIRE